MVFRRVQIELSMIRTGQTKQEVVTRFGEPSRWFGEATVSELPPKTAECSGRATEALLYYRLDERRPAVSIYFDRERRVICFEEVDLLPLGRLHDS